MKHCRNICKNKTFSSTEAQILGTLLLFSILLIYRYLYLSAHKTKPSIHVSPTIGREDGTFGFAFFEYIPDRNDFIQQAIQEITRVKNSTGLSFSKNTGREDVIRYSSIPWFSFSEMKHAVSFKNGDSVPSISTGKLIDTNGKMLLPISICAHHGLMDGKHIAQFLNKLSEP